MKPVRTLVAVVNENRLRLLENRGVGKGLVALQAFERAASAQQPAGYADMPGRSSAAPGIARHAMEPSTPPDEQARQGWARDVAARLEARWQKGGFDRLVVAAPPKMLGQLRGKLGGALAAAIQADLAKDLMAVPDKELAARFASVAAF